MKVLLIGYSKIAKKRILNFFINKKYIISVATISNKKKIKKIYKQYTSYNEALKRSDADIVYISLPNSLHYKWAHKALSLGYHVIVGKPLCNSINEVNKLIKLAFNKNRLLSEATFFNYHDQFKKLVNLINDDKKINKIDCNFTIPKPLKNSILSSTKLNGGVLMDMGPYAAAIARIFLNEKILSYKVFLKKDKNGLTTSLKFIIKYNSKNYYGKFKFGGTYNNTLKVLTNNNQYILSRVFSPPSDKNLNIEIIKNKVTILKKIKKDDCFANYFNEVSKKIKEKKYDFYSNQIKFDNYFRNTILKK